VPLTGTRRFVGHVAVSSCPSGECRSAEAAVCDMGMKFTAVVANTYVTAM
jgi:hypothetical protein